MLRIDRDAELFPDERVVSGAGTPALAMFRRGAATQPLVLFLPGGGHLARIAYGHRDARPEDFLLTHLSRAGFSTLALSYPSAHASVNQPIPEMTITQWAQACVAIAGEYIAREHLPPRVIALGWSLAGRLARNLAVLLRQRGIGLEIFIGLSAVPPIPGFGGLSQADLCLAPSGLLDGSSAESPIFRSREGQLAVVDRINGRVVIPRDVYARHYVTDSPINFRGEAERYHDHRLVSDISAAVSDQGSFDFANYPLCGSISGGGPSDARHAVAAAAAWGMLNAQSLYFQIVRPALECDPEPKQWPAVRGLMSSLTTRLSRRVDGSHFFFVGERGASETARCVGELAAEADAARRELTTLLS
jgi:hypothetical protein